MKHLAFATYELHPVNPGGAGVLLAGGVRLLARAGFRSSVVGDFPQSEVDTANELLSNEELGPGNVRVLSVASLVGPNWQAPPGSSYYEAKSIGFLEALRRLHQNDPFDLVEFPEYAGMAYSTLSARALRDTLSNVGIVVRIHGGLELIDQAEGVALDETERFRMYQMERASLRFADAVLAPSAAIGEWYSEYYQLPGERILVAPPPMENLLPSLRIENRFPDPGHFLFYGKLQEVKGCDLLLQAAGSIVADQPDRGWRFTLVGRDTPCTRHRRMVSACLKPLVPRHFRAAFEFVPEVQRSELKELVMHPLAAIMPSRFETFCLAAHELRAIGLPLIVSNIPAFADYFSEATGCLVFDGSANGLKRAILRMRDEPGLWEALASRPGPHYLPFVQPYRQLLDGRLPAPAVSPLQRKVLLQQLVGTPRT